MKGISGKDFAKLLQRKGWELKRITGSHHIHAKTGERERISVPIHGSQTLKIGLLRHFMKVAGVSEDEL